MSAAVILLVFPAFGAGSNETQGIDKREITIGSSAALGGHASFLGTQLTQGSLALIKEINSKGGIYGRTINLICYDDGYEPTRCAENTRKLINQDKVFILFDYVGTPTAKVVVPIVNENQTPILGLFTGAEFLRNPFQPYIFNVRASYFAEVEAIVDYWAARGKTKIAVFLQNDDFGYSVLAGVQLALARHNLEVLTTATYSRGELPDVNAVDQIVAAAPSGIVMVGTYTPLAHFVKMAKEKGLSDAEFHTVSFVGSEAFAEQLLSFTSGVEKNVLVTQVVPSPYDSRNPTVREFQELYKKYYPDENYNYVALEGFINAKILITTLERCGKKLTRKRFMQTLETMSNYNAGTGLPSVVGPSNHSFFDKVFISSIAGDKFVIFK
ncbi:MAG: ABC transporter substrate-binding protein [candidate division FCPU426 bacterium]